MLTPPRLPPEIESLRLAALRQTGLLDSACEARFDRLTRLARTTLGVDIALISLVDEGRQWFKSRDGLATCETSRDVSFCAHAIVERRIFEVPDAAQDPRFADNPLVTGDPHIRFYAGAPLSAEGGHLIGTLCLIDRQPRRLSEAERQVLRDLADCVEEEIQRERLLQQATSLMAVRQLGEVIVRAQALFIQDRDRQRAFETLLEDLLELTGSDVGLLGEVQYPIPDTPQLQIEASSVRLGQTAQRETGKTYDTQPVDSVEDPRLKALFEQAVSTGQPVQGRAAADGWTPRWQGRAMAHTLCIPIHHGDPVVAMVCLAKTHAPFDAGLLAFLRPLLDTLGQLIQAAQVLREHEHIQIELARLSRVASETTNAVLISDPRGRIEWVNEGFTRLTGYSLDEVLGERPIDLLFGPESDPATIDFMKQAMRRRESFNTDVINYTREGKPYWVHISGNPLFDANGQLQGFLAIESDITERKQAERELVAAREAAEAASRAKSEFLANMSHEIRTPMNAVLGMAQLLQGTELERRQKDYVDKIEGAANSLLGILNDILDFSKVEAGKMLIAPERFELAELLRDVGTVMSSYLGTKTLDLLFDIDPAVPETLVGDALRLRQVLINLGGNAIKFTAQGEVTLRLRLLSRAEASATVAFEMQDTGIGIPPEHQARIFEGFSQAEANTTRRFGGTGLGLAISQRLVSLMGGALTLDSEPGQGSTFRFELPLGLPDAATVASGAERPAAIQPSADAALAPHVLLVDTDGRSREVLAAMCAAGGWRVETADSVAQASERLAAVRASADRHDLVLVDGSHPGLDAWALVAELQRLHPRPGPERPALILLGSNAQSLMTGRDPQDHERIDGFLVKPVTLGMLRAALDDSRAAASRVQPPSAATVPMAPAAGAAPSGGMPGVAAPAPRRVLEAPAASLHRLQGLRVLLAEDNPINQQVARELLKREGCDVTVVDNGRAAVDEVSAHQGDFDVVLMDMQMPEMDGLEAARQIRGRLNMQSLPIIAMTANAMESDRQDCLATGMNDHIGKPFKLDRLVDLLRTHCAGHFAGAALPPAA